jgi:hypothetical protein
MFGRRRAERRGSSSIVEMLFVIGGIGLAFATAIVAVVVRARRRRTDDQVRAAAAQRRAEEERRHAEEEARAAAEVKAQRQAELHRQTEEEARAAAEREAKRRAEEEARAAADREAEAARRRADEELRIAAAREMQRRQAEEAQRRAEEEARAAAEVKAQRQAEEARRRSEEEARAAAEREAEEARRAEQEARAAAELEAQRQAEEARRRSEEEARVAAEREAEEAKRRAEQEARAAAELEAQRRAEETRAAAEREAEEARRAEQEAELEAQRQAEEAEARVAAEEAEQREAEKPRRRTDDEARAAAEAEAQHQADHADRRLEQPRVVAQQQAPREADEARDRPEEKAREATQPTAREVSSAAARIAVLEVAAVAGIPLGGTPARRRAPEYRPPRGAPSVPRQPPPAPTKDRPEPDGKEAAPTARALSIEVRVLFDRGGCGRVTLLPKRRAGLPDECAASRANGGSLELVALEEEWYQDVAPEDLATMLRTGTVWTHQEIGQEWALAGREIFVLAAGTTHRGFVSSTRLVLGREHVVLCATTRLAEVEEALQTAGCPNRTIFREEDGAPSGWVLVGDVDNSGRPRGLFPTCAVPMVEDSDILNVLRPLPEIEISLEGGVPLGYTSWLAGFPPLIRVLGDAQHVQEVLIDGKEATLGNDAAFRAPDWDAPGVHQVWCSNVSRSYSLVRLERSWQAWPAYVFPSTSGGSDRVAICGPLVRPLVTGDAIDTARSFEGSSVLQSNPILLGALPGQVFIAVPRRDVRGARCFASPPFQAVWALPANPLHCDKATCRIFLVATPDGGAAPDGNATAGSVSQWCRLIRDASRKGLSVEPAAARDLWAQYKRVARSLSRRNTR